MLKIAALDTFAPQPWRNGRGTTREIMIHDGHTPDSPHFWRISLACIEADGPFSLFPGLVRQLALASSGPLTLQGVGSSATRLNQPGDMIRFDGAYAVSASCHGQAALAFNLIAAPGVHARMERHHGPLHLERNDTVALFALQGEWRAEGCDTTLPAGMIAWGHTTSAIGIEPVAPALPACLLAAIISTPQTEKSCHE